MKPPMTLGRRAQFLRAHQWKPNGKGDWFKSGWFFKTDEAYALELIFLKQQRPLPSRYSLIDVSLICAKVQEMARTGNFQ